MRIAEEGAAFVLDADDLSAARREALAIWPIGGSARERIYPVRPYR